MLRAFPKDKIALLVVWERILLSDTHPPSNRELGRVVDLRAVQFWDKDRWVSRAIRPPILARGQDDKGKRYRQSGEALWDTVAVYPARVRWGDGGPEPAYTGGPVVNVASDLQNALREAVEKASVTAGQQLGAN